jgi:hypothetical protein
MADGQGEAAWGTSGQVTIGMLGNNKNNLLPHLKSITPLFHGNGPNHKLLKDF